MRLTRWVRALCCVILVVAPTALGSARSYEGVHVIVKAANVRSCPSMECDVRFVATWGQALLVIDREDLPWICVNAPGRGTGGWIHEALVSPGNPKGQGSSDEFTYEYTRMADTCLVHVAPPLPEDMETVSLLLARVILRAYVESVDWQAWQSVPADSVRRKCLEDEDDRYCFEVVHADSTGIDLMRVWRESK